MKNLIILCCIISLSFRKSSAQTSIASQCFVELGTTYLGFDLIHVSTSSISDCCNICGLFSLCNNLAYQSSTGTCYLKTVQNTENRQVDPSFTFGMYMLDQHSEDPLPL
jgi:hypothetical protein